MQNLIIKPMIGVINGWVLPLIMKAMTLMEGQFFSQNIETADHSYYPQDLTANAIFTNTLTVALLLFFLY